MPTIISAESLARYPELEVFLASEPANIDLLSRPIDYKERFHMDDFSFSMLAVLSLYGKSEHIHLYLSLLPETERKEAIKDMDYQAIRFAVENDHTETVQYFLQYPSALNYVERHHREYSERYTSPYVTTQVETLLERKAAYEAANPHGVFNIQGDEVEHAFLLLRHLIRRNKPEDVAHIEDLMSIPALRAVLSYGYIDREAQASSPAFMGLAGTGEAASQLLRLAGEVNNQPAVRLLIRIETMMIFRALQPRRTQNLTDIARDRESSMRAPGPAQKRMADAIQAKYADTMRALGGVKAVFERLKKDLLARYEENPAKVTLNGGGLTLPFSYEALQELKAEKDLTDEAYQTILKAYHAHPVHTAFRYLSKPNLWMDGHASFVNVSEDGRKRWSTFEEYIPTIAYFYLAASDEKTPSVDASPISSRVDFFIQQVALIGRAHNWDQCDVKGRAYDDIQQGDKPSCYSGVSSRLYQSVIGHPLMMVLTQEIVKQAIHEFKLDYFKQVFSSLSAPEQKQLFADYSAVAVDYDEPSALLQRLNIPKERVEAFQKTLREKYGEQFDATLCAVVAKSFKLGNGESHFSNFYEPNNMKAGLEAAATKPALETRRQALFAKTNKAAVKKDDYQAIRLVAQKGEFEKIQSLFSLLDKREKAEASYLAIHWAAKGGHIKIMDYLIGHLGASRAPNALENQRPVAMDNVRGGVRGKINPERLKTAFWGAAVIGVAVLGFVVANIPTAGMLTIIAGVTMMIAAPIALLAWGAKEYANTTHHDSTVVPKHSATIRTVKSSAAVATKTEPKEAIKARNYRAIRWAAQNGHTKTLQYLFRYLSTQEIQEALKAADDQAIRWAARNGHTETHQYLLFLKQQRPDAHYVSPHVTPTSTEKEALLALIKDKTPSSSSPAFFASSAGSGYQAIVEYLKGTRDELTEYDIPEHLKEPINAFATSHGYKDIKDLIEALRPEEAPSQAAAPNPG